MDEASRLDSFNPVSTPDQKMKKSLVYLALLLSLTISTTAHCQTSDREVLINAYHGLPQNQYWHWFDNAIEATDWVLQRRGWTATDKSENGQHKTLTFLSDDKRFAISLHLFENHLGAITFGFPAVAPETASWITANAEPTGEGKWRDTLHNATITRRYTGDWIMYRVDYTRSTD